MADYWSTIEILRKLRKLLKFNCDFNSLELNKLLQNAFHFDSDQFPVRINANHEMFDRALSSPVTIKIFGTVFIIDA